MDKTNKIWNRRFILLFITNLLVLAAFYASILIITMASYVFLETGAHLLVDGYYNRLKNSNEEPEVSAVTLSTYMEHEAYTLPDTATVREWRRRGL